MPSTSLETANAAIAIAWSKRNATPALLQVANWLVDRHNNIRQAQMLRDMSGHRLANIGVTRLDTRESLVVARRQKSPIQRPTSPRAVDQTTHRDARRAAKTWHRGPKIHYPATQER